jgi:hypothetical protein
MQLAMPLPILPKPIKVTFISALHIIPYARTVKSFAEFSNSATNSGKAC